MIRLHYENQCQFSSFTRITGYHTNFAPYDQLMGEVAIDTGDVVNSFFWYVPGQIVDAPFSPGNTETTPYDTLALTLYLDDIAIASLWYQSPLWLIEDSLPEIYHYLQDKAAVYQRDKLGDELWLGAETAAALEREYDGPLYSSDASFQVKFAYESISSSGYDPVYMSGFIRNNPKVARHVAAGKKHIHTDSSHPFRIHSVMPVNLATIHQYWNPFTANELATGQVNC